MVSTENRDSEGTDSEGRENPHWDSPRDRDFKARDSEIRASEKRDSESRDSEASWKAANGGAKRIVRFWGGKRTIECALQNQFWRPQEVGFAWSVPVSSKENNRAKTNGGGKTYHRWGGPKPFLGSGFMVCFPLP